MTGETQTVYALMVCTVGVWWLMGIFATEKMAEDTKASMIALGETDEIRIDSRQMVK